MANYFKKDIFLSKHFKKDAYNFSFDEFDKKDLESFLHKNYGRKLFISSKVSSKNTNACRLMEEANFKLVDTNINLVLKNELKAIINESERIQICLAKSFHKKELALIARNNFIFSRFHLDPLIRNDIADKIKESWVENYFSGKRGDAMIVAILNKVAIGFLQLIRNNNNLIIDLIAVDKAVQGMGVGTKLISFAYNYFKFTKMIVGTQIENKPSINFYQKLGFEINSSFYVLHYHN